MEGRSIAMKCVVKSTISADDNGENWSEMKPLDLGIKPPPACCRSWHRAQTRS
jgi:hypothetical protein